MTRKGARPTAAAGEAGVAHVCDTGFGFNANATIVDTNKPYDRTDISRRADSP